MRRVADREAPLDAGMAVVRMAVLVRHHAHELLALHLGAERAADAAVRAGRDRAALRRAFLEQRFLDQRAGRTRLHAGAARNAFGIHERIVLARGDLRQEAAAFDGQRERALLLVARAHATRADDALRGIEAEIRIGFVDVCEERIVRAVGVLRLHVIRAVETVAHFVEADGLRHLLDLGAPARRRRDRSERMIGKIKLHDAAAQLAELFALRRHLHAGRDRRRARSRKSLHAFDLHEAEPARAERVEQFRRAELRDRDADFGRGAQHRSAGGHADFLTVDGQRDDLGRLRLRRAEIGFSYGTHVELLRVAAPLLSSSRRRPG